MRSRVCAVVLIGVATVLFGCSTRPVYFRIIDFAEAQSLIEHDRVVLVEAPPQTAGAPRAAETVAPAGRGVLVFGDDLRSVRIRAAALARAGNQTVLVFVPRDADERGRFYAVAAPAEEDHRGKDS